jgi:hypothetical protein
VLATIKHKPVKVVEFSCLVPSPVAFCVMRGRPGLEQRTITDSRKSPTAMGNPKGIMLAWK